MTSTVSEPLRPISLSSPTDTVPPLEMTRLLPVTVVEFINKNPPMAKREFAPVTSRLLTPAPCSPNERFPADCTVPPSEMIRLLLSPAMFPRKPRDTLVQSELLPVTSTLLTPVGPRPLPIKLLKFATVPPLEMTRLAPLLPEPTRKSALLLIDPRIVVLPPSKVV